MKGPSTRMARRGSFEQVKAVRNLDGAYEQVKRVVRGFSKYNSSRASTSAPEHGRCFRYPSLERLDFTKLDDAACQLAGKTSGRPDEDESTQAHQQRAWKRGWTNQANCPGQVSSGS